MSVVAPPRPPDAEERSLDERLVEAEALIEEARERARRRRRMYARAAVIVLLGGLAISIGVVRGVGVGAETAESLSGRLGGARQRVVRNGPITIFTTVGHDGVATVETVGTGRPKMLWRCPGGDWCGEPVSSAWSPDGTRLALTTNEITLHDLYPFGFHLIDVGSGRDARIPRSSDPTIAVGCRNPTDIAWSPNGKMLAYHCGWGASLGNSIVVLDLMARSYRDGAGIRAVPTQGPAFWPSWSPDSKSIAYSTAPTPRAHAKVFTLRLDGSKRQLLARGATAPAWSPDGSRIAYETRCGLRLVTPGGQYVTPRRAARCQAVGPVGLPSWSPDGMNIAIATHKGVYVVNADGTHLHRVSRQTSNVFDIKGPSLNSGLARPSWRPLPPSTRKPS